MQYYSIENPPQYFEFGLQYLVQLSILHTAPLSTFYKHAFEKNNTDVYLEIK